MKTLLKCSFALFFVFGIAISWTSCSKETIEDPGKEGVYANEEAGTAVTFYLTNKDGSKKFAQQTSLNWTTTANSYPSVTVNTGTKYQTIDGFGFTLTQASAKVISGMSASAQSSLLNELFSTSGIGISVIRIGIGATDLSDYAYSYRDGASFSLSGPDLTYTIPILKKILAINSSIKVLATPWSAPMWMKAVQPASFTGGTLAAAHYESYGQYWLDYMNAMKAQGITIWAITPQNEPLNGTNCPSMTLTKENELGLINSYIGPKLRGAGFNCKIICYDHNCDNTDFPTYVAKNSSYVDGSAFHLYAGSISALTTVKNATGKNVYFTEQYTGSGGSFSGDFPWHVQNVMIGSVNNWAKIALEWNLAANTSNGPYISGTCSTCLPAVTINGSNVTRNVSYYIIAHMSKFVRPNAVRVNSTTTNGSLVNTAFTSGSNKVLVVQNTSGSAITFKIVHSGSWANVTLNGGSAGTFVWQ
jgi:glucosylceramidase